MPKSQTSNQNVETETETRPRSRRMFWLICLAIFAAVLFFLPAILLNSPLKQTAINYATADIEGTVQVGGISAGWFSPIEINDLVIKATDGTDVVSVSSIQTSKNLIGLASGSDYGTIKVVQPTIDLKIRPDGSNLEDVLVNFLAPAPEAQPNSENKNASSSLPKVRLEIVEGVARMQCDTLEKTGLIEKINSVIECMNGDAPLVANAQMTCSMDQQVGNVTLAAVADNGQQEFTGKSFAAQFKTEQLPVASLVPVLTRALGPVNAAGTIDSDGAITFDTTSNEIALNISNFTANEIAFVAPELIGQDQFVARSIQAAGELQANSMLVYANQFRAESEFARLNANGKFDVEQLMELANGGKLPDTGFQLDAAIDLAQVTAMLPETTHMRDGVKMNSGVLQVTANTRNEGDAQRMVVNAETANVNFVVDGQNIVWNKPLRIVGVAGTNNGQLMLEDFQLQSDFLTATGFAGFDRGRMKVEGDLQKVTSQLQQVMDLGGTQVAGLINGEMGWQLASGIENFQSGVDLPVGLQGRFNIQNPMFEMPGLNRWNEEQMILAFTGNAITNSNGKVAINNAAFELQMGGEHATGELNEPIADLWSADKYQFQCEATGSMAKWIAQGRNFVEFPEFICDGNMNGTFLFTLNQSTARLNQIKLDATDFIFNGFAMDIREPKMSMRGHLKYHLASGNLQFLKTQLATASVSANTDELTLDMSRKILADGELTFRADANRASQWLGLSKPGDSIRWDGDAKGKIAFNSEQDLLGGDLNAQIENFVVVQPTTVANKTGTQTVSNQTSYAEVWREADVQLVSKIALTDDFDNLLLNELNLKSKMADLKLDGRINQLSTTMLADLQGQWNVDWENLNQLVNEMAGEVAEFQGQGWQPIAFRGPLYDANSQYAWIPNQLQAVASVNWDLAEIMNLPLGSSNVEIRLDQSLATISSQGNSNIIDKFFQLQPVVDLRSADPVLHLRQGNLLEQFEIGQQDSRTWLKYAAPLIADATSAQGQVSATVEGAAVPLFDPMKASARGALDIHNLTVGAGPLVQQLIPMIDQIKSIIKPEGSSMQDQSNWMQLPQQTLPFAVQEGRVHHEGFRLTYKDIVIETQGSVGFDQTINLVANIPILEEWVGSNQFLSRLVGKSISIPIQGTLSKPQLDRRAIAQFTQQLVRESAMGAVNDRVQQETAKLQEKYGSKIQGEVNRFQEDVNGKLKSQFEDKVQSELRNGLNKLFGGDKK